MVGIEQNITSLVKVTNAGPTTERRSAQSGEANNVASVKPAAAAASSGGSVTAAVQAKQAQDKKDAKSDLSGQLDQPLDKAAEVLQSFLPNVDTNVKLRINHDEGTGRYVYQGIDKVSGEVVNQFPSEEILKFLKSSREVEGLILDTET